MVTRSRGPGWRAGLKEAAQDSIGIGLIRRRNPRRSVRICDVSLAGIIMYANAGGFPTTGKLREFTGIAIAG
jgi:hypothetical protein